MTEDNPTCPNHGVLLVRKFSNGSEALHSWFECPEPKCKVRLRAEEVHGAP